MERRKRFARASAKIEIGELTATRKRGGDSAGRKRLAEMTNLNEHIEYE